MSDTRSDNQNVSDFSSSSLFSSRPADSASGSAGRYVRRHAGHRVVRATGAAGAKLPVVHMGKAADQEPDAGSADGKGTAEKRASRPARPSSSRSRRSVPASAESAASSSPSVEESRKARLSKLASEIFSDKGVDEPVAPAPKPVAQATPLFRAPDMSALPAVSDSDRPGSAGASRSSEDDRRAEAGQESDGEDLDQDTEQTPRRRHRSRAHSSRRLNAKERAAAAEVGSIEEDLAREKQGARHHDGDEDHEDRAAREGDEVRSRAERQREDEEMSRDERRRQLGEDLGSGRLLRRRVRRSVRAHEEDQEEPQASEESEEREGRRGNASGRTGHTQSLTLEDSYADLEDGSGRSRVRRRRRAASGSSARPRSQEGRETRESREEEGRERSGSRVIRPIETGSTCSVTSKDREKAYISKIKDVKGSTRLEAKRRRRREGRRTRAQQTFLVEQDYLARRDNVDRQMVVREKGRHTQISVIEDNILVEHYVSDIDEVSTVGNIYVGRVQNVLPSMEAAFVNIGEPRNGVLYAGEVNWDSTRLEGKSRRIELAYHSGDPILVQVTKDPIGHKGARLTSQVTLAGRYIVLVPSGVMTGVSRKLPERERTRLKRIVQAATPKDMGVIIRTAAEGASKEAVLDDLDKLINRWKAIQVRYDELKDTHRPHILHSEPDVAIRVVRDIFNDDFRQLVVEGKGVYDRIHNYLEEMSPDLLDKLHYWDPAEHQGADVFDKWHIDGQLRKGMEREVYLPSGGSLVIDRTEAMTTIDVNTGRFIGKGKSLEETVTRCNLEAAEEIVRQLRLRDIGGMIMIDFVDMVMEENRDLVLRRLVECLSRDRTKHQVAEVTSLGLVQMTRKRVGQGLVEAFSEECPTCHGRGFIIHDEPTIEADAFDPYEVKGGDPFEKSKGRRELEKREESRRERARRSAAPRPSSEEVKAKLAQIAAAATRTDQEQREEREHQRKQEEQEPADDGSFAPTVESASDGQVTDEPVTSAGQAQETSVGASAGSRAVSTGRADKDDSVLRAAESEDSAEKDASPDASATEPAEGSTKRGTRKASRPARSGRSTRASRSGSRSSSRKAAKASADEESGEESGGPDSDGGVEDSKGVSSQDSSDSAGKTAVRRPARRRSARSASRSTRSSRTGAKEEAAPSESDSGRTDRTETGKTA